MTFDQLEILEMIVLKGSFKAASEALHKTQPTLSVAIKKLEDEFNLQIFSRAEYRPKLTEKGITFYNWAKQCLSAYRELKSIASELGHQQVESVIKVVLDPLINFDSIEPAFSKKILDQYPTEINFSSEILYGGFHSLLNQQADIAIGIKPENHEQIESFKFDTIELVPVISKKLIEKNKKVTAVDLKKHHQIVVLQNTPQKENQKQLIQNNDEKLSSEYKTCFVSDHHFKLNMILKGFGWGKLNKNEIKKELSRGDLIVIKNEKIKTIHHDIYLMRSKIKPLGPVGKIIWSNLIQIIKK